MLKSTHQKNAQSFSRGKKLTLLLFCLALGVWVRAYVDNPLPRHSGGFGEPTCHQCHSQYPLNEATGSLTLEGVPESYQTGERYSLLVRLNNTALKAAGFQIAARYLEGAMQGKQAGTLESVDDRVEITTAVPDEIQYAHHSAVGTRVDESEETSWQIVWTAPADPVSGSVIFHVAANAGNGDDSEFGDRVYIGAWTTSARIE